jgi:YQGE family putative transporter
MERITTVLQRVRKRGPHRRRGFIELFISKRLIQGLAAAMLGMFLPIFLYETSGNQFWVVVLFFALASIGYVLFLVPGMKFTNLIGFSKALALGAVFSIAQYVLLYFTDNTNLWALFPFLLVAIVGFRVFHWVPYHVDFTAFTKGGERGRDVSLIFATIAFMGMLGPVLAGYIISNSGYDVLFGVCTVLLMIAGVSYLFVPAVEEKFTWTYIETYQNLFSPRFRNVLVGEMANGAEVIVTLVAWPIFLFEVLQGNLLEIGLLSTVVVGVTIAVQLFIGKHLDSKSDSKIQTLKRGSILYAVGWLIKIFVFSAVQIFFIGLYHNVTKIFIKTPYSAILYDLSGEQGRYVDEFTVMREMASHIGRTLALLVMFVLTFYVPVAWTFLIGAVASLLVNAIYKATS